MRALPPHELTHPFRQFSLVLWMFSCFQGSEKSLYILRAAPCNVVSPCQFKESGDLALKRSLFAIVVNVIRGGGGLSNLVRLSSHFTLMADQCKMPQNTH